MSQHLDDLHERYRIQAGWTKAIRSRIFEIASIPKSGRILEVGSGTGVIVDELSGRIDGSAFGLDIDPSAVHFSQSRHPHIKHIVGDGHHLPFPSHCFDMTLCHFLLLWVRDPRAVLQEMMRVTHSDGWVIALAEPDYGGRIDYPSELADLGKVQEQALLAQGCDTRTGRRLRALFNSTDLSGVQAGVLGGEWGEHMRDDAHAKEWPTLARDLAGTLSPARLESFKVQDYAAWRDGSRILYVPTFYALGRVP